VTFARSGSPWGQESLDVVELDMLLEIGCRCATSRHALHVAGRVSRLHIDIERTLAAAGLDAGDPLHLVGVSNS